jgi:6-phosphofructokinase 1
MPGSAVIGQSGGPTSVINQSLVGVIEAVRRHKHIDRLLGARHGVRGIVDEKFIQLDGATPDLLERIAATPSSALGSTRDKPDEAYCARILEVFRKHDVRYFFYIGGNDSADTARIVQELAAKQAHDLHVFHIPKTIDNDLRVHDHTPGFGSAAKFVACAMIGDDFDNRSLPGIKIDVIMGRHAGFLTAASALARVAEGSGPHLIFVPERPVSQEDFVAVVERVYAKQGRCLIAVSEGITAPDGRTYAEHMADNLERDAHGNLQLSGSGALGDYLASLVTKGVKPPAGKKLRVRADTFGYLQRSFAGFVSEVDADEARMVGRKAVEYSADAGHAQGSVVMLRTGNGERYGVETRLEDLKNVARLTRHMDDAFLGDDFDVTDAWIQYARPLVGRLPVVGTFDELR